MKTLFVYRLLFIACIAMLPFCLWAQIFPAEGSVLNYRLVGLSFLNTGRCRIEIASGSFYSEDSFRQHIILSQATDKDSMIVEVPAFGSNYTWRVQPEAQNTPGKFHHFSTAKIPDADTSVTRLRILKNASAYKDAFVFVDATRTLYDMQGRPVWFLPNLWHFENENFEVRDMKLSPQGTITFIIGQDAYEVNYNAKILWKAPAGGEYHHQVTRLSNGHYMVLGSQNVLCRMPTASDNAYRITDGNKSPVDGYQYTRMQFGTVMEYDKKGRLVWSWKSAGVFKKSDIVYHKNAYGIPEIIPHENSFYFDEQKKVIYISFRNISRILKVQYPTGDILNTYGELFSAEKQEKGNGLFCQQHSCKRSRDGYLYLYNNNACNKDAFPTVLLMREPANGKGTLKKVWEYECIIDNTDSLGMKKHYLFPAGGNVTELPDSSFFISIGAIGYSEIRIVDRGKNILWRAVPERKNPLSGQWQPVSLYEANIITGHRQLGRLIWSGR